MRIYFGIDGGGTHSRLLLVNEAGEPLAKSEAGSTNIYSVSKDKVKANIAELLEKALPACGCQKEQLSGGCFGSAGLGRAPERELYREFFDELLGRDFPVYLCTDGEILLAGGLDGLEGYCLIAGTGSVALGRSRDGRLARSGGHGYMLGDEGSAAWIGRTAIARILRSMEMRDIATDMLSDILEAAKLGGADELVRYVHHDADKAAIAALAPAVTKAALKGDPLAKDIFVMGAYELFLLIKSVIGQSPWIKSPEIVLAGGVMEHDEIMPVLLRELISKELPHFTVKKPKKTALEGACILALNS